VAIHYVTFTSQVLLRLLTQLYFSHNTVSNSVHVSKVQSIRSSAVMGHHVKSFLAIRVIANTHTYAHRKSVREREREREGGRGGDGGRECGEKITGVLLDIRIEIEPQMHYIIYRKLFRIECPDRTEEYSYCVNLLIAPHSFI